MADPKVVNQTRSKVDGNDITFTDVFAKRDFILRNEEQEGLWDYAWKEHVVAWWDGSDPAQFSTSSADDPAYPLVSQSVGYWRDKSQNGYDATAFSSAQPWDGNGVDFSSAPLQASLNGFEDVFHNLALGDYAIFLRFRSDARNLTIAGTKNFSATAQIGSRIYQASAGAIFLQITDGVTIEGFSTSNNLINEGETYDLVITRSGTLVKIYLDGVEVASATQTLTTSGNSAAALALGGEGGTTTRSFDGLLKQALFLNRAATDDDVAAFAAWTPAGETLQPNNFNSLYAWWDGFQLTSMNTEHDDTGNPPVSGSVVGRWTDRSSNGFVISSLNNTTEEPLYVVESGSLLWSNDEFNEDPSTNRNFNLLHDGTGATLFFRVKNTAGTQAIPIATRNTGTNVGFWIILRATGEVGVLVNNGTTDILNVDSSFSYSTTSFTDIAVAISGTGLTINVDNQTEGFTFSGSPSLADSANALALGRRPGSNDNELTGEISHVVVFDEVLSLEDQARVFAYMDKATPFTPYDLPNLEAWWDYTRTDLMTVDNNATGSSPIEQLTSSNASVVGSWQSNVNGWILASADDTLASKPFLSSSSGLYFTGSSTSNFLGGGFGAANVTDTDLIFLFQRTTPSGSMMFVGRAGFETLNASFLISNRSSLGLSGIEITLVNASDSMEFAFSSNNAISGTSYLRQTTNGGSAPKGGNIYGYMRWTVPAFSGTSGWNGTTYENPASLVGTWGGADEHFDPLRLGDFNGSGGDCFIKHFILSSNNQNEENMARFQAWASTQV